MLTRRTLFALAAGAAVAPVVPAVAPLVPVNKGAGAAIALEIMIEAAEDTIAGRLTRGTWPVSYEPIQFLFDEPPGIYTDAELAATLGIEAEG